MSSIDRNRENKNKAGRGRTAARMALAAAASLAVSGMLEPSLASAAGVHGAKVVSGSAIIRQQGPRTMIRAADRTIIRYDRFDVPKGSSVVFIQPSARARVLNRIVSDEPAEQVRC